jgi:DegV family protein with EDD domain
LKDKRVRRPVLRIEVVDSYSVSLGLGHVVRCAAEAASAGASLDQVIGVTRKAMDSIEICIAVDTLEYLHRGGRIGRARSWLGSVLSIKPIIAIENGEVTPFERVRTRRRAEERIFEVATRDRRARALFATCTGDAAATEAFADRIRPLLPFTDVRPGQIGPVVGVYVGPNAVGVAILHGDGARARD